MFNLTVDQLLNRILDKLCFLVIEIIAPQRYEIKPYRSVFMALLFLVQLFKTKR